MSPDDVATVARRRDGSGYQMRCELCAAVSSVVSSIEAVKANVALHLVREHGFSGGLELDQALAALEAKELDERDE